MSRKSLLSWVVDSATLAYTFTNMLGPCVLFRSQPTRTGLVGTKFISSTFSGSLLTYVIPKNPCKEESTNETQGVEPDTRFFVCIEKQGDDPG